MARKTKTPKVPKVKKAKAPRPERVKEDRTGWVTFALRLPPQESAAFHKAAGPGAGSRTARQLLGAFAREDRAVFESIVEDARKLRA